MMMARMMIPPTTPPTMPPTPLAGADVSPSGVEFGACELGLDSGLLVLIGPSVGI